MTRCGICGRDDAKVRETEIATARITGRAHVDCRGHSEYRPVTKDEIDEAEEERDWATMLTMWQ